MSNTQIIASVPLPVESLPVGDVETTNVAQFLTMLQAATPEQAADILSVLDRGLPLWSSRKEALEAAVAETTPVKAKKAAAKAPSAPKKEKAVKVVAALPEAAEGAPDAADYRVDASSIDEALCIGRNLKGGEDKRWKPIIYRESQCGGKRVEGSDLCTKCSKREEKCAENPAKPGDWNGRITEEPEAWVHMLGTTWAEEKGCKFVGGSADTQAAASSAGSVASVEDAAEAASENGSAEEMPAVAAPKAAAVKAAVADKKAEKAASAAAKLAEKEAAKAAKEAEKEAAQAAKAAEKDAAKAAKAAEKEAEKLAKAAAKPAAAPKAAAAKPKAAAAKPKAEAKKAAVAEPVAVEGELTLIDGTLYMVKNGNVFEYDELAEKAGDFVGRLTGDETIDTEADEVTAAESDTD